MCVIGLGHCNRTDFVHCRLCDDPPVSAYLRKQCARLSFKQSKKFPSKFEASDLCQLLLAALETKPFSATKKRNGRSAALVIPMRSVVITRAGR